jgi:phosphoenolpyruvate carboxykinase (GTP)
MLPFCGYNMGDYFNHWLDIGKATDEEKLPKIFFVNWFRKDENGKFLWPGFGDNIRVIKWMFQRCNGNAEANKTPVGYLPTKESLDLSGIDVPHKNLNSILSIDKDEWREEADAMRDYYKQFGNKLPEELKLELDQLEERLNN